MDREPVNEAVAYALASYGTQRRGMSRIGSFGWCSEYSFVSFVLFVVGCRLQSELDHQGHEEHEGNARTEIRSTTPSPIDWQVTVLRDAA